MEPKKFKLTPLPIESEFRIHSISKRLKEMSRSDLEDFLTESLRIMTTLAHQVKQLSSYVDEVQGKISE
jgi:hypothetical protein